MLAPKHARGALGAHREHTAQLAWTSARTLLPPRRHRHTCLRRVQRHTRRSVHPACCWLCPLVFSCVETPVMLTDTVCTTQHNSACPASGTPHRCCSSWTATSWPGSKVRHGGAVPGSTRAALLASEFNFGFVCRLSQPTHTHPTAAPLPVSPPCCSCCSGHAAAGAGHGHQPGAEERDEFGSCSASTPRRHSH